MASVSSLPKESARKPVCKVRKVKKYCENCAARRSGGGYKVHNCEDCQYFDAETGASTTKGKKRPIPPSKAAKIFCEDCTRRKNETADDGRIRKNAKHKCEACRKLRAEAARGGDEEQSGDGSDELESQEPVLKRRHPELVAASSSGTLTSETATGSTASSASSQSTASSDHGPAQQDRDKHGAVPKKPWFCGTEPGVQLPDVCGPDSEVPDTWPGPPFNLWAKEEAWSSPPGHPFDDPLEPSGNDSTWSSRSSRYDAWRPDFFEDENGWIPGHEEDEAS